MPRSAFGTPNDGNHSGEREPFARYADWVVLPCSCVRSTLAVGRPLSDVYVVFAAASLAVLASACGALPLALHPGAGRSLLGTGTAVASGVMLAVSGGLVLGSPQGSAPGIAVGVLFGIGFVQALRVTFARHGEVEVAGLAGADGSRALLIVGILTIHSAAEAIGLASAFAGGRAFGWTIGLALAIHKLPEGFAVCVALVPRGVSVRRAAGFAGLAAAPLPLLAVPAFLFVDAFRGILPVALGFAAGAMVFVVASEMLPEARRRVGAPPAFVYCAAAFAAAALFELGVGVV
jgi:ZIP family zinc transporter